MSYGGYGGLCVLAATSNQKERKESRREIDGKTEGKCMATRSPHAIVLPCPGGLGHMYPMLELCKRLATSPSAFRITFVYTKFDWRRLQAIAEHDHPPNIEFQTIGDRIPLHYNDAEHGAYIMSYPKAIEDDLQESFDALVALHRSSVTCIISDFFLPWSQDVANKHSIPMVVFYPQSATVLAIFASTPLLEQHRLSDASTCLVARGCERAAAELLTSSIPGVPSLRGVDLPFFWVTPGSDAPVRWIEGVIRTAIQRLHEAACVLCNTAYGLEGPVLDHLRHLVRTPVVAVGPLLPASLVTETDVGSRHSSSPMQNQKLRDDDGRIPAWLDSRAANSVLYVSLGSVVNASPVHILEIALGLKASKQPFLWVVRGFVDSPSLAQMMPPSFLEETAEQGLVVPWAPQLLVLSHPAVGGFLTHGGWNSTLEAITMGVPMIVWPWLVDQKTNSRMVVEKLGVGKELAAAPSADFMEEAAAPLEAESGRVQVERRVRTLMQEQAGCDMRSRMAALSVVVRRVPTVPSCETWIENMLEKVTGVRSAPGPQFPTLFNSFRVPAQGLNSPTLTSRPKVLPLHQPLWDLMAQAY